jgi:hypothetical protein
MAWSVPLKIADYLSDPAQQQHLRPPETPGVYVISERYWAGPEPPQARGFSTLDKAPTCDTALANFQRICLG